MRTLLILTILMVGCAGGQHIFTLSDHGCILEDQGSDSARKICPPKIAKKKQEKIVSIHRVGDSATSDSFHPENAIISFGPDGCVWAEPTSYTCGDKSSAKPEPEDVLAIQEKVFYGAATCHAIPYCKDKGNDCNMAECTQQSRPEWTCSDKKRVLLTSVDGSIHVCHKVSEGK